MVKEINSYHKDRWMTKFLQSDVYQRIRHEYCHVIGSYREMSLLRAAMHHTVYIQPRNFCDQYRILDAIPYYYLEPVMQNDPTNVLDLGCGLNIFKTAWPQITGMDADPNSRHDLQDFFDDDFVSGHRHFYDAVISINSIHFAPIDSIGQRLAMVRNLVRPGGQAFVSFNLETWLMHTDYEKIKSMFGTVPVIKEIVEYINQEITATGLNFTVMDWPVLHVPEISSIRDDCNGNIRLVFQVD